MSVIREVGKVGFERATSSAAGGGHRRWTGRAIGGVLIVAVVSAAYSAISLLAHRGALSVPVTRADLVISLSGYGVVESRDSLDITCEAPGSLSILEIVPDGSMVRKGDLLARLDRTALEQAIAAQKRELANAEAAVVEASKDVKAANVAIDAYREGAFVQERLRYDHDILLARKTLAAAEHSLLQTQISHRRGFGSRLHVEAREFVVETAQSKLAAAKHKKQILEEFTGPKTLKELASKSGAAAGRWKASEAIVEREKVRLKRLLDELPQCVIRAPRDGMAIYAGGPRDRQDDTNQPVPQIYPGVRLRRHQTLLRLADLDQLQIKMAVSENKIGRLRRGQRVHVKVLGQERQGEIVSIADRPQTTSVADLNFKQHAVGIAIERIGEQWKPGLTAEVEVLIEQKKNVLTVPVICVAKQRGEPHLLIKTLGGGVLREVTLGMTNDVLVEIIDGASEGELVLLNSVLKNDL
jgi:HlyD family secretion protein